MGSSRPRRTKASEDVQLEIQSYNTSRQQYINDGQISPALRRVSNRWLRRNPLIDTRRFGGQTRIGFVLPDASNDDTQRVDSVTFLVDTTVCGANSDVPDRQLTADIDWAPHLNGIQRLPNPKTGLDTFFYTHYRKPAVTPSADANDPLSSRYFTVSRLPQDLLESIPARILVLGSSLPYALAGYQRCRSIDAGVEKALPIDFDHVIVISDLASGGTDGCEYLANYQPTGRDADHQPRFRLSLVDRSWSSELYTELSYQSRNVAQLLIDTAETSPDVVLVFDPTIGTSEIPLEGRMHDSEQAIAGVHDTLDRWAEANIVTAREVEDMKARFTVRVMGVDKGGEMDLYEQVVARHRDALQYVGTTYESQSAR